MYRCLLADPPWECPTVGRWKAAKHGRPDRLPYPTLSVERVAALPVSGLLADDAHCWLWTTNSHLRDGYDVLEAWGFKPLAPVTWVKPSGFGAWFAHRTQTLLFGYRGKLSMGRRFAPTVLFANPGRHSEKPAASYDLVESVSPGPRLELFARRVRPGWAVWGNEVVPDVQITA